MRIQRVSLLNKTGRLTLRGNSRKRSRLTSSEAISTKLMKKSRTTQLRKVVRSLTRKMRDS